MEQSIDQLYRLYAKELYWFIFSICKDTDLSDDILQTTFVEAIKSIEKFKGQSSVKTWLFSIAKIISRYQNILTRLIQLEMLKLKEYFITSMLQLILQKT